MTIVTYRGSKNIVKIAKNLDAFPKVPDEYIEPSLVGGTLSLFSRILIVILICKEISYYRDANLKFSFQPDIDLDNTVKMHIDLTVATPCIGLYGIDLVDETQETLFFHGALKRENTWWKLNAEQRKHFNEIQQINTFLREEYHSVAEFVFKDILFGDVNNVDSDEPKRTDNPNMSYDACRLHGTLTLNKVAGIFHIVSGESTPHFGFLNSFMLHGSELRNIKYNFSHRINKLSFGDTSSHIIQPLEGDERYIPSESVVVQYFIEIVPTEIHKMFSKIEVYQYSVKENFRHIDSHKNSYGVAGIYFKYDWSALKVSVRQDRDNIIQFVVRLCSIIAGIAGTSEIISSLILLIHKYILKLRYQQNSQNKLNNAKPSASLIKTDSATIFTNNLLLDASDINNDQLLINALPQ